MHRGIFLNPFPKINRFVAWSAKRKLVAALALVMQPYSIMGGVLHPGNNPKQLQTIQTVHKLWRSPPSCRFWRWLFDTTLSVHKLWRSPPSRRLWRWLFDTAFSEIMSFYCRKAQTDSQIRVRQLPPTPTTLTDTIVPVRRTPNPQRSHDHQ